jgi:hypothetical protein
MKDTESGKYDVFHRNACIFTCSFIWKPSCFAPKVMDEVRKYLLHNPIVYFEILGMG